MADEIKGLICACLLDGKGGARELGWDEIEAWTPEQGYLWIHFDFRNPDAIEWIHANVNPPEAADTLLADETRPRAIGLEEGMLLTLRGVNLNPESDPEDMVSIRMWVGEHRAVTTRHRRIMAVTDAREAFARGTGPRGPGELVAFTADNLMQRMGPTLDGLSDMVDTLEGMILEGEEEEGKEPLSGAELRRTLGRVRRQTIELRRYMAPQREAMTRLQGENAPWLGARHRARLREVQDHITRYVEDLDALRDRGAVIQDELRNRISEDMNRTMYVLTVVAAVLLPLSFITGLLGINVEGMPGAQNAPNAFWLVVGGLVLIGVVQLWLFRRLKWL